jgi:hypothetical protein
LTKTNNLHLGNKCPVMCVAPSTKRVTYYQDFDPYVGHC